MPAEWEPQAAVWLSWPHNRATWPGKFRPVPRAFATIVAHISRFEAARVNIARPLQARARALVLAAGADPANVHFHDHPTDALGLQRLGREVPPLPERRGDSRPGGEGPGDAALPGADGA
jgi:agmatine/peptidylarginine deiminase